MVRYSHLILIWGNIMDYKHHKTAVLVIMFMFILVCSIGAQGVQESETAALTTRTAIDALGRTVTVEGDIERIMVVGRAAVMPADALYLFPSAMEMDIVLAKTDQGLGDFFTLIRPEFATENRLGQQVGAEEIIAHNPDLVLTKTRNYDSVVKLLEPFNIPVFVMDLETPASWKSEIIELGKILGDTTTPIRVIAGFERRESEVSQKIAMLADEDKPTVLMMQVAAADGVTAFSVAPQNWIQTVITELAGAKPIWSQSSLDSQAWRKVSFEQIAAWDPEKIFLISYQTSVRPYLQSIYGQAQWQNLRAVSEQMVKGTPGDVMNYIQSDSRWILALQWLAAELHPTLFPDFSMEDEIVSFYSEFYGITDQSVLDALINQYQTSVHPL